ncbi:MAG: tetratricopeptide repeat protein [Myxococcales bacterium]|nr:tetratricopeptide repeat protein [Myxococcales bacterium]
MMRFKLFSLVLFGTLLAGTPAEAEKKSAKKGDGGSADAGMCIDPGAPTRVAACPKNMGTSKRKKGIGAPKSRLRQATRKKDKPKGLQVKGPSIELDVATLRNKDKVEAKAESLLRREITVTKRLIKNTRTNDPRRADFLLRLAEGYFELVQVATRNVRKLDDPIYDACSKKKNKGQCSKLRKSQKNMEQKLNKTREQNIKTLAMLVRDHPDYKKMDEVLFSLGFSLEEMKQFDRARQVYHRLIKGFPQSSFIPNAYLSFAEYYFQQGDMGAAKQFYQKVTEIPPERNRVYGYAVYKQAWCDYNLEDFKGSLQRFVETIEFAQENPEAHNVENLARQSRREMIMPYAQVGNPGRALEFFSRYAKDEDQAFEMFESLGELYYDTGQWPEVIAVYHKLIAEKSDSEKVCYWQTRVANAVISSKPKKEQVVEVQRMLDLYDSYADSSHSGDAKKSCRQSAASVLIELATAWHREAIGTDTQPGTNDKGTMEQATKLYRMILKNFPDMEEMEFPDIDKRDWPTEYKVSYYYAELLWKMEAWAQCGPAFDRVLEVNPKGEFTEDSAYASVLCYNKQYKQTYAQSEREVKHRDDKKKKRKGKKDAEPTREELVAQYKPKELSPLEEGMLRAYKRYICYVPGSEDLPTIKYRQARIYYETNHFEEASVLFKDIAFNHVDSDLSVFAANLYLDSLNVVGTYSDPARPGCYDEMNDNIEPLYGLYCKNDEQREEHLELCEVVEQLRCDLLRKKAEGLQTNKSFKKAAQLYVRIFRQYRECGRLDEVLYNAALNFEAARLLGRAIKVRRVLIDKYPESEWSKRAIYLIGANFHALAMYDMAADYYEKFAEKYSGELGEDCSDADNEAGTCPNAKDALQNATFFRLGLGDEEKAVEDAQLFEKSYKKKFARETSQVKYSLGSIYERTEDWNKVIKHYTGFLKQYKKTAMPHEMIQGNVTVGRAYLSLEGKESQKEANKRKAMPYFKAAVKFWQGSKDSFGTLAVPDDQKQRYLAYAKIASAEALFHLAGEEFDKFASIKFPVFKTKKTIKAKKGSLEAKKAYQEEFQAWMAADFTKWMGEKAKALDVAQTAYGNITEMKVPQWEIAAATRVGDMYLSFVNDFRDAPVPPVLEGDEELVDIYYQGLDEASQPWVQKAKGAYEFCLITATKVRWFNEYMTKCEEELFKLDPRTYPRAAELRGSDIYTYSIMAEPGLIELKAGSDEGLEGEE